MPLRYDQHGVMSRAEEEFAALARTLDGVGRAVKRLQAASTELPGSPAKGAGMRQPTPTDVGNKHETFWPLLMMGT